MFKWIKCRSHWLNIPKSSKSVTLDLFEVSGFSGPSPKYSSWKKKASLRRNFGGLLPKILPEKKAFPPHNYIYCNQNKILLPYFFIDLYRESDISVHFLCTQESHRQQQRTWCLKAIFFSRMEQQSLGPWLVPTSPDKSKWYLQKVYWFLYFNFERTYN